jgi:thiamin-phosphate kinase
MRPFRTGKIPTEALIHHVFRYTGRKDPSVILGSSVGEDAALVSFGDKALVLTTDPVTGTASDVGWLSVHINANDVACRGAKPRWFLCDLLLPEGSNVAQVDSIMKQVDLAAKKLGVAVVGGHTEVTPGLNRPIIVGYMLGVVDKKKFVTSSNARPGDDIIMTKSVGIEGTAVLAADFGQKLRSKIGDRLLFKARRLRHLISVVDDAMIAVRTGGVHAMHDPTEGGLIQGLWELAEASGVGFKIYESQIAIRPETERICANLDVDPLRLMSSGCLLMAADRRKSDSIIKNLRKHRIHANIVGVVLPRRNGQKLVGKQGFTIDIGPSERDEIYRVLEESR